MTREFIVSTSPHLAGARLSLVGQWGNIPFDSIEAAEAEAIRLGASFVTLESGRAPRKGKRR